MRALVSCHDSLGRRLGYGLPLVHPDAPRDRPHDVIRQRAARRLEGQLNLAVVVPLMPEHVLEEPERWGAPARNLTVAKIFLSWRPRCFVLR
jgi:hypothetical protein